MSNDGREDSEVRSDLIGVDIDQLLVDQSRKSALMLNKTKFASDVGMPGCWLGGEPTLPPEFNWPCSSDQFASCPMTFLLQINLAQIPQVFGCPKLPELGTLYFFQDLFFPTELASVIYYEKDPLDAPRRSMPKLPDKDAVPGQRFQDKITGSVSYHKWNFEFLQFDCFYPLEGYENVSRARRAEIDKVRRITAKRWSGSGRGSSCDFSMHHMFGAPSQTMPPSEDAILLLTIVKDSDVGIDTHGLHLHFWIKEEALKARSFGEIFLTGE